MASGLALVAPSTGGLRHYADSGNAWLVEPTAEAFAAAIQAIRADGRSARRTSACATAERFDWDKVTAGYFELYDEIHALVRDSRRVPAMARHFIPPPPGGLRYKER
jgi:glycosyltransferase involved in cell wall biosynthesis